MAFEKVRAFQYICDTKEDLKLIPEKKMGVECFVIKEACEYKLMSDGEWIKQIPVGSGTSGDIDLSDYATEQYVDIAIANIEFPETDLTGYATEEFVKGEIAAIKFPETDLTGLATEEYVGKEIAAAVSAIEIPSIEGLATEVYVDEAINLINANPVMKMFAENPEIMASNPGSKFGIALNSGDTRTLPEAMLEKGVGLYNFWIHKSNASLPAEAFAKKSSCRGICCVDTVKSTGWYGWALLVDQDGDLYVQYIRNSVPQGWKSFVSPAAHKEAIEKLDAEHKEQLKACYRPVKYEITDVPAGTIVDYRDKEIRIFCPESVKFEKQNVGEGGNANMYYMTFITYAPEGAVGLREGDKGALLDEYIPLEGGSGCGVDKFDRKYKKHWFALASYDNNTGAWTYFGKSSTTDKYIGWTYVVAWYDKDNRMIDTDILRINLSNKNCHLTLENSYIDEEATIWAELLE